MIILSAINQENINVILASLQSFSIQYTHVATTVTSQVKGKWRLQIQWYH